MADMISKIRYLARSLAKLPFPETSHCPNCGCASGLAIDRKYCVTRLIRCDDCALMFRAPTDNETFNKNFYNFEYRQGTTTQYPNPEELERLKATSFSGSEQGYAGFVAFLKRNGILPGTRILDFGCSWGYGSYQFAQAGYHTYSFEIAVDRRNYGIANLGIRHIDDAFEISPGHPLHESFDCFFSAHVLEHVPSPSKVINLAWRCLKPTGAFVAFTPNGCNAFRQHDRLAWSNMWGGVHPNYLDDVFYEKAFSRSRRLYEARDGGDVMKKYELGFIAWKDAPAGGF